MSIVGWIKLWWAARKAVNTLEKELPVYDKRKTILKGLWGLLIGVVAVAAQAGAGWLADSDTVMGVLAAAGLDKDVISGVTPIVVALALMLKNWLSNRGK